MFDLIFLTFMDNGNFYIICQRNCRYRSRFRVLLVRDFNESLKFLNRSYRKKCLCRIKCFVCLNRLKYWIENFLNKLYYCYG